MADKKGVMKLQIPAVYEMECDCDPFAGGFPGTGCECDLSEINQKLDDLAGKVAELEVKIENCDCCDCPTPGVTISLSETAITLNPGSTKQLIATVGPADLVDKSVTWISSDPLIATVDQNGLVTAVANGNVSIAATTTVGGKSAACAVTIKTTGPTPEFPLIGLGEVPCRTVGYDAHGYNWTPEVAFDLNESKMCSPYSNVMTLGYSTNYWSFEVAEDCYMHFHTSNEYCGRTTTGGKTSLMLKEENVVVWDSNYRLYDHFTWAPIPVKLQAGKVYTFQATDNYVVNQVKFTHN